jgi:hypothetical protein
MLRFPKRRTPWRMARYDVFQHADAFIDQRHSFFFPL